MKLKICHLKNCLLCEGNEYRYFSYRRTRYNELETKSRILKNLEPALGQGYTKNSK